jgi:hypothetical protein
MDLLKSVGASITSLPESFTPHRQIKKIYEARRAMVDAGAGVDWAMAEALAFATLLSEGNHVRLSGQVRGGGRGLWKGVGGEGAREGNHVRLIGQVREGEGEGLGEGCGGRRGKRGQPRSAGEGGGLERREGPVRGKVVRWG